MSFPIGANESWDYQFDLTAEGSTLSGIKYAILAPAGAVLEGWATSYQIGGTGTPVLQQEHMTAPNVLTTAFHQGKTAPGLDVLSGSIRNGANAGSVTLRIATSLPGNPAEIFAGSKLVAALATKV